MTAAAVPYESGTIPSCRRGDPKADSPINALIAAGNALADGELGALRTVNYARGGCDVLAKWGNKDLLALSLMTPEERGVYLQGILGEHEISTAVTRAVSGENGGMHKFIHRIKSPSSVYAQLHQRQGYRNSVAEVRDLIRYTVIFDESTYMKNTLRTMNVLLDQGFEIYELWNAWTDTAYPYNGINTTLISPKRRFFELQFHTAQGAAINDLTHGMYEKRRTLPPDSSEYQQILRDQFSISDQTRIPADTDQLKTYLPSAQAIHG